MFTDSWFNRVSQVRAVRVRLRSSDIKFWFRSQKFKSEQAQLKTWTLISCGSLSIYAASFRDGQRRCMYCPTGEDQSCCSTENILFLSSNLFFFIWCLCFYVSHLTTKPFHLSMSFQTSSSLITLYYLFVLHDIFCIVLLQFSSLYSSWMNSFYFHIPNLLRTLSSFILKMCLYHLIHEQG